MKVVSVVDIKHFLGKTGHKAGFVQSRRMAAASVDHYMLEVNGPTDFIASFARFFLNRSSLKKQGWSRDEDLSCVLQRGLMQIGIRHKVRSACSYHASVA